MQRLRLLNATRWLADFPWIAPARPPVPFHAPALRTISIVLLVVAPLVIPLFVVGLPLSKDWLGHYVRVGSHPLHPYSVRTFFNPPWFSLPLALFTWMPARLSQAINAYLNFAVTTLIVIRYGGSPKSLVLTLLSLPFATVLIYGNVEWISMSAFLVPPAIGLILLVSKPQTGALASLVWLRQVPNKLILLAPLMGVLGVSLVLWGNWPADALANVLSSQPTPLAGPANASVWPWLIPVGILLAILTWRREDELLGVAATLCLSPYFVIHSATLFFGMLSARSFRLAVVVWITLWASALLTNWHLLASPSP